MNLKNTFTAALIIKKVGLFIFLLYSFAYANNPPSLSPTTSSGSVLQLESSLIQQVNARRHASNHTSAMPAIKVTPKLALSKYLSTSPMRAIGNVFDDPQLSETELKIAVGVQPTVSKEEVEVFELSTDESAGEEALEPYAGEFTPNTEEENNIILASMLIIFTGAAIIAILSYI